MSCACACQHLPTNIEGRNSCAVADQLHQLWGQYWRLELNGEPIRPILRSYAPMDGGWWLSWTGPNLYIRSPQPVEHGPQGWRMEDQYLRFPTLAQARDHDWSDDRVKAVAHQLLMETD